jgi:HSP20 family molecular chaperone IbpA
MIIPYNNNPFASLNTGDALLGRFWSPDRTYRTPSQVRVIKNENTYMIQAPVPGIEKEAIDVTVNETNRTITIKGETATMNYEYITAIPRALDLSTAEAVFNNGMIEIEFPLAESENQERKLELSVRKS